MPTVASIEGYEIRVLTRNEHRPRHVHVFKADWEPRVRIGELAEFWDIKYGAPSNREVRRAIELVGQYLDACNMKWEECNGHL
ncbi:MAG TPA: DUF4160 domain-containing protein [Pantanalinema sp.]